MQPACIHAGCFPPACRAGFDTGYALEEAGFMSSYLEFSGISKSYPGVKALSDVSFGVRKGAVHGLMGENGAGKSTLMRILSGDAAADEGTVRIDGETQNY